jgi:hypothetical protein
MRILVDNILRAPLNTIESGTEDESFIFANMWDNRMVLQGRITEEVIIDLGVDYAELSAVDTIALKLTSWTDATYLELGWGNTATATDGAIDISNIAVVDGIIHIKDIQPTAFKARYWRITSFATPDAIIKQGSLYVNYLYLGQYKQLPNARAYEEPIVNDTDNIRTTVGGQVYTQLGYTFKEVEQSFRLASKSEVDDFYSWYTTSDRANNNIFIQFEDDTDTYPPLFGRITSENQQRFLGMKYYPFNIKFREAK